MKYYSTTYNLSYFIFFNFISMSVNYPSLDPRTTIRQALAMMMDTHTYTIRVQDTTLTIHHLLEATRQGHPTTTTLNTLTQNPPHPTLAITPTPKTHTKYPATNHGQPTQKLIIPAAPPPYTKKDD